MKPTLLILTLLALLTPAYAKIKDRPNNTPCNDRMKCQPNSPPHCYGNTVRLTSYTFSAFLQANRVKGCVVRRKRLPERGGVFGGREVRGWGVRSEWIGV
jgi:hypothetical protein